MCIFKTFELYKGIPFNLDVKVCPFILNMLRVNTILSFLDTYEWSIVDAKGALMLGSYGHSAVYDVISDVVFVYGGFSYPTSGNSEMKKVSDMLYTFTPTTKSW